jgi:hypothetical protein
MVKHVTEEDLASGLSGFGDGFSTITERPRRDSPFRDTRSETEVHPAEKEEKVVEIRPAGGPANPPAESSAHAPRPHPVPREQSLERPRENEVREEVPRQMRPEGRGYVTPSDTRVRTIEESARQVRVYYPDPDELPEQVPALRKADIFTERVTLSVSREMRDEIEALARELQRRRTRKDERITANTVMRVAINLLLERFSPGEGEVANNEEELLALARTQAARK